MVDKNKWQQVTIPARAKATKIEIEMEQSMIEKMMASAKHLNNRLFHLEKKQQ